MNASLEGADANDDNQNLVFCTPLSTHVKQTVLRYLDQLHGHDVFDLHEMVMTEVEKPLLQAALEHAGHNQTKAAKILGLSRSTLRKKMEFYDLS